MTATTPVSVTLNVNGRWVSREAGGHMTLLRWLRENADALDPKYACGEGICGACTVLVDGEPVSSCIVLAAQFDGAEITHWSPDRRARVTRCPATATGPTGCHSLLLDTTGADRPWVTTRGTEAWVSYHNSGNSAVAAF